MIEIITVSIFLPIFAATFYFIEEYTFFANMPLIMRVPLYLGLGFSILVVSFSAAEIIISVFKKKGVSIDDMNA
jgi:hypothetical protein